MSDTKVYEPYVRALFGTASEFNEVVVLKRFSVWGTGVDILGLKGGGLRVYMEGFGASEDNARVEGCRV